MREGGADCGRGVGCNGGLAVKLRAKAAEFHQHAEDVFEREVRLLNVHRRRRRNDDVQIAVLGHLAAAIAAEASGCKAHLAGKLKGADDVAGASGGRDAEEDVAARAEGFDLAGEDAIEGVIVRDGSEQRGVGGESDGAECRAVGDEAANELGGEVLGVGCGAAIAGDEQFSAGLERGGGEFAEPDESVRNRVIGEDRLQRGDGLGELPADDVLHRMTQRLIPGDPSKMHLRYGMSTHVRV